MELQLPSPHEMAVTHWYWDYVMTIKLITESSLWEAKKQLEDIKAQMEVIVCFYAALGRQGGERGGRGKLKSPGFL